MSDTEEEYKEEVENVENVEENDVIVEDEPEPVVKTLRKPKRVYNLTEEQKQLRLDNLKKGREILRQRKLIRDEYLKSKKEETEQHYNLMKEKTKIHKEKVKATNEIGSYELQKEMNELKKKLASLEAGQIFQKKEDIVKENLNRNFEKIQEEEQKRKRIELLRRELFGY